MPTAILAAASATVTSGLLCPTPSTRFSASTSGLRHCPHATDPRLSFRENHGTLSCSSASHQTSDTLPCSVSADPPSAQRLTPRRCICDGRVRHATHQQQGSRPPQIHRLVFLAQKFRANSARVTESVALLRPDRKSTRLN